MTLSVSPQWGTLPRRQPPVACPDVVDPQERTGNDHRTSDRDRDPGGTGAAAARQDLIAYKDDEIAATVRRAFGLPHPITGAA